MTPRYEVNDKVARASDNFRGRASYLLGCIDYLNKHNFDLRKLSHQQGKEYLESTLDVAKLCKNTLQETRKILSDVEFNIDWLTSRTKTDLERVKRRIDGEASEAQGGIL